MDDIERRLRELGSRAAQEISRGPVPSEGIVRRARLRKGYMALGSLGLVGLLAVGGYAGVSTYLDTSSRPTGADEALEAAATATKEQGSVRLAFRMSGRSDDGSSSRDFQAQGTGEIDFEAQRSYMKYEAEGISAGFTTIEFIMDGTTTYMKGALGAGDKWIKTDHTKASDNAGAFDADQWSAAGILDDLTSASKDVEVVGHEELDGMWVTHYRAILDPERAGGMFGDPGPGAGRTAVVDVWVDEQTIVRKTTHQFSIESDAMSMEMTTDMHFFDYGAPVDINVPDPEDVTENPTEDIPPEGGGIEPMWISGEGRWHDSLLLINLGLQDRELCLFKRVERITEAQVIEEPTGEVFAAIDDIQEAAAAAGDLGENIVCFADPPRDLTPLINHPNRYTLRLSTPESTWRVPLITTQRMDGPD